MKSLNVLYDSVSNNTGDIAIGLASRFVLNKFAVQALNKNPFLVEGEQTTLISGGELLRKSGDFFYDRFRLSGQHILNATGVNYGAEGFDYLRGYRFVSARSSREAEILSKYVPEVKVLPCATTMWANQIAASNSVTSDSEIIGIHLAPHAYRTIENLAQIIGEIPRKKIFFSFTPYNGDFQFMKALFDDGKSEFVTLENPESAIEFIGACGSVITTSLHASIFSYSQGIPFISIKQQKVFDYFSDRNMQDLIVGSDAELQDGIQNLLASEKKFSPFLLQDLEEINSAFGKYSQYAFESKKQIDEVFSYRQSPEAVTLHKHQFFQVITDHDVTLAFAESRKNLAVDSANHWKAEYQKIRNSPFVKFALSIKRFFNIFFQARNGDR